MASGKPEATASLNKLRLAACILYCHGSVHHDHTHTARAGCAQRHQRGRANRPPSPPDHLNPRPGAGSTVPVTASDASARDRSRLVYAGGSSSDSQSLAWRAIRCGRGHAGPRCVTRLGGAPVAQGAEGGQQATRSSSVPVPRDRGYCTGSFKFHANKPTSAACCEASRPGWPVTVTGRT